MMFNKFHLAFVLALSALVVSCVAPDSAALSNKDEIARGGRLYDQWSKMVESSGPLEKHPSYPASGAYAKKARSTWRCKECHGWDYKGKAGAYKSGKHFTGIMGIRDYHHLEKEAVVAVLKNKQHQFLGKLTADELNALALFVTRGQIAMDKFIDPITTEAKGDVKKGKVYYNTLCSNCHGAQGKMKDMPDVAALSRKNPWECLHKTINGQPDEDMPALIALDIQVSVDILAYMQSLPK